MRVRDHIGTLLWTAADKFLFILYGFVHFYQIRQITPLEYGLFAELMALHTFIFSISDGFALQGIIKFGADPLKRGSVNRIALLSHISIGIGIPIIIYLLRLPLASLLDQPEFSNVAKYLILYSIVSLPQLYCIKFLSRDIRVKAMFIVNLLWFGTMVSMTIYMLYQQGIHTFEHLLFISFSGMLISSIAALLLSWHSIEKITAEVVTYREMATFGSYQVGSFIIGNLIKLLDVIVVEYFFSTTVVGIYSSAKQLFRVFDQLFEAISGIIYTGGVRLVHQHRYIELSSFISKATSFSFISMIVVSILLELGAASFFITYLLSNKYIAAVGYFKILLLATPILPFVVLSLVIVAFNQIKLLFRFTTIASVSGLIVLLLISAMGLEYFIPVGVIVYYFVLGALCYNFVRKQIGLSPRMLLRAVPDSVQFVKELIAKRRNASS